LSEGLAEHEETDEQINPAAWQTGPWQGAPAEHSADLTARVASNLPAQMAEEVEEVEEVLSLQDSEKELIRKALSKHRNRRKYAALELGISERTLYRKIKEYGLK
jgi:transcriptional regulator with PAS, ATPase and Fis domain